MTPEPETASIDTIIVGAGAAGCTLAARLSENADRSVLLLEAGRHYGSIDRYPWALRRSYSSAFSVPGSPDSWPLLGHLTSDVKYPVARGKVVGGSSAVNGALFLRGHPEDYEYWAGLGNPAWSFDAVLPYFIRQETDLDFGRTEIHGATGPMPVVRPREDDLTPVSQAFLEGCLALGFPWDADMNSPDSAGVGLVPTNSIMGLRRNAAVQYLEPVLYRPNLTLMSRTVATRIVFQNIRAVGVETISEEHGPKTLFADEIILCAGGLNSPQLLMLSGVGPPNLLRSLGIPVVHPSPSVGQGLMDHPGVKVAYRTDSYRPEAGHRPLAEVALNHDVDASGLGEVRLHPFVYTSKHMLFGQISGQPVLERLKAGAFILRPLRTAKGVWGTSLSALQHDVLRRSDLLLSCGLGIEESRGAAQDHVQRPSRTARNQVPVFDRSARPEAIAPRSTDCR